MTSPASMSRAADSVYAPPAPCPPWRLEDVLGRANVRYYSLGRWALVEALRLAGAGPGRNVLMPEYICRELLACARVLGAAPLLYAVDRNLRLRDDPSSLPPASAVIVVDYFGFPQDLAPFEAYCRRAGAMLIEDNAHGLFGRDASGRALGTRAPLGVFSLRKTVVLPNGGALAVNDAGLAAKMPEQLPFEERASGGEGPSAPSRRALRRMTPWLGARGVLGCIRTIRRLRSSGGTDGALERPDGESGIPGTPEPCAELSRPLRAADPEREVERRRNLYEACAGLLRPLGVEPVFDRLPEGVSPYVFPFHAPAEQTADIERTLAREGLFSLPWPDLPREVAGHAPSHYVRIRGVHFLW